MASATFCSTCRSTSVSCSSGVDSASCTRREPQLQVQLPCGVHEHGVGAPPSCAAPGPAPGPLPEARLWLLERVFQIFSRLCTTEDDDLDFCIAPEYLGAVSLLLRRRTPMVADAGLEEDDPAGPEPVLPRTRGPGRGLAEGAVVARGSPPTGRWCRWCRSAACLGATSACLSSPDRPRCSGGAGCEGAVAAAKHIRATGASGPLTGPCTCTSTDACLAHARARASSGHSTRAARERTPRTLPCRGRRRARGPCGGKSERGGPVRVV